MKKQQRIIGDAAREWRTEDGGQERRRVKRGNIETRIQRRLDMMITDFRKPELKRRPPQDEDHPTMGSKDKDVES